MKSQARETVEQLERALRRRYRTEETRVSVHGHSVVILHPASAEDLIDEEAFEHDERLPYWADLWPSARILSHAVIEMPGAGRTLLELGCGAGLVASCAALSGFTVTVSDYYAEALEFARVNVAANAGAEMETLLLDWRDLPPGLARFDVVLASDVLYERGYGPLVARAIARTLAPGGEAVVADPGRLAAGDFVQAARDAGLTVSDPERRPFVDGKIRQTISLYRLHHRKRAP